MSIAPLRSLRSFWAAGGAPGALLRRDAQLRDRLERISASASREGALTDESSYAALLRSLDLNGVFAREIPERTPPVEVRPERERRERHASPPVVDELGRSRPDPRPPTSERAARVLSNARGDGPREEGTRTRSFRPFASSVASSRDAAKGSPSVSGAPVADRDDSADRGVDALRASRRRLASLLDAAPARPWRDVAPVALDTGEQRAAAVARILAAADPTRIAKADEPARSDAAARTRLAPNPGEQLATIVQRAERRLAEQRSKSASRVSPPDTSYGKAVVARDRGVDRDDWMAADYAVNAEVPNAATPRPTGMRGLAVRSFESLPTMRAPLFGLVPNGSVDWPSSDGDQFSNALDDAARREGVELGELDG